MMLPILADYGGLGLAFALLAIFFLVIPFVIAIPIAFFISWRNKKPPSLPAFVQPTASSFPSASPGKE